MRTQFAGALQCAQLKLYREFPRKIDDILMESDKPVAITRMATRGLLHPRATVWA